MEIEDWRTANKNDRPTGGRCESCYFLTNQSGGQCANRKNRAHGAALYPATTGRSWCPHWRQDVAAIIDKEANKQ